MNGKKVMLTIQGEKKEYPAGTSFLRIAQDYSDAYQDDIVLVLYNRRLRELNKCADGDGTVEFLTTADKTGKKAYRRSVTLLMQKAVYNLWGKGNISVRVKYSIGQGNYCELVKWENDTEEVVKVSGTEINKLKNEMYQMVVSDIEIHKESINTDDAVTLFHDLGMTDKEKLFRYRRSSRVNIYELDHYMDYFYGFMVPSTGYLRYYDVIPYADGFMLQFPDKNTREVAPFVPAEKLFHTLKTSRDWGKMLEIDTIGACDCYTLDLAGSNPDSKYYRTKNLFFYSDLITYDSNFYLPAGKYLSVLYKGPLTQTKKFVPMLADYAKKHHLKTIDDPIEFCHIDDYETALEEEYITEIQWQVE